MVISLWPRFLAHPVYRRLGWLPVSYFARVKYPRIAKAYRSVSYRREISFFAKNAGQQKDNRPSKLQPIGLQ